MLRSVGSFLIKRCKPFIILRLYGGIGNQLFSYATALRLSQYNNVPLYIDARSGFFRDSIYKRKYRLNAFAITNKSSFWAEFYCIIFLALRKISKNQNRVELLENRIWIQQEKIEFDERISTLKISHPVIFEGYWQSEKYFLDIESRVRKEFSFLEVNNTLMAGIFKSISLLNSVAIHVRHFNDSMHPNKGNISDDYYFRAIKYFSDLIPDVTFYIFSDDPENVRQRYFSDTQKTFLASEFFNDGDEIKELSLMSRFKYFIIGNSTFSWWGAWLSQVEGKVVLAPAEKVNSGEGSWGFDGLIPEQWVKL